MRGLLIFPITMALTLGLLACGGGEEKVRLYYEFQWRSTPEGESLIKLGATNASAIDWSGDDNWKGLARLTDAGEDLAEIATLDIPVAPALAPGEMKWFAEWVVPGIPVGPYFVVLSSPDYGEVEAQFDFQTRPDGRAFGLLRWRNVLQRGSGETTTSFDAPPSPVPGTVFDFGDAPDPNYPSLASSDGARHKDVTRAWFGTSVDAERDAADQVDVLANTGDEFDDALLGAKPFEFSATNNDWDGPLYVNVLLDLNKDGDWEDEGEWVLQNMEVNIPMGETVEFPTDVDFAEETHLRMTLTSVPLEGYIGKGEFEIGETEDHMWSSRPHDIRS
jgi:hypothetical protein